MYYVDVKYLRLLSSRLPKFKQLNDHSWNCRCILCGDSKRNENKSRGYFYKSKDYIVYKCHNCGVSKTLYDFLKSVDSALHKEYIFELYKESTVAKSSLSKETSKEVENAEPQEKVEISLLDKLMDRLDTLDDDNLAVKYCIERKIPRNSFHKFYFIDDIRKIVQLNEKYKKTLIYEEPRLFIPFYDLGGSFVGGTMRALRGESMRYVTVKIKEDVPYIFGILDVDPDKALYVVEGPFDSLFLDNAIAVGGSSLSKIKNLKDKYDNVVYIYDNQPYNKEICKLISRQIDKGDNVVIWPSNIREKDINEMILAGKNIKSIVQSNIVSGLGAKLKFNQWKKC